MTETEPSERTKGYAEPGPVTPTSMITLFVARREGDLIRMTGAIDNKLTRFYCDPSVAAAMIEHLAKALADQNQH